MCLENKLGGSAWPVQIKMESYQLRSIVQQEINNTTEGLQIDPGNYGHSIYDKPCLQTVKNSLFLRAEAGGSRGQEIETILVNKVKPRLY